MTDANDLIPASFLEGDVLDTHNWHKIEQKVLSVAYALISSEDELGAIGYIVSAADWAALDGNTDANGNVRQQPTTPAIAARPAPSDGSAADHRRYELEDKEWLRKKIIRKEIVEVQAKFKAFLLNKDVVGKHYAIALGSGDQMTQLRDTPRNIFNRLKNHLGTPDSKTYHIWSEVYREVVRDSDVFKWVLREELAHTLLSKHGQELSAAQRLLAFRHCFKLCPAVMKCWEEYCTSTPIKANQNLIDALAYVTLQEPNIREAMTKADIGLPTPLACHAFSEEAGDTAAGKQDGRSVANAAVSPVSYSQEQLEIAVAEAVSVAMMAQQQGDQYCWMHGFNPSHPGSRCKAIVLGKPIRANRDSRAPLADTMVFGRVGGISITDAKNATKPLAFPRHPGNAIRPGETPHP
jgi:hypothetical protein